MPLQTLPQGGTPLVHPRVYILVQEVCRKTGFFPLSLLYVSGDFHTFGPLPENCPFSSKWDHLWCLKASFAIKGLNNHLYGCETWILDSNYHSLSVSKWKSERGFFVNTTVRLCLSWPSLTSRLYIWKMTFLTSPKLLSPKKRTITSDIFTTTAINDPWTVSIIQSCRMLETRVGCNQLGDCLEDPDHPLSLVKPKLELGAISWVTVLRIQIFLSLWRNPRSMKYWKQI